MRDPGSTLVTDFDKVASSSVNNPRIGFSSSAWQRVRQIPMLKSRGSVMQTTTLLGPFE